MAIETDTPVDTTNPDVVAELRRRCGIGPSILKKSPATPESDAHFFDAEALANVPGYKAA